MNKEDDEEEPTSKDKQEYNEIVDAKSRQIYDSETKTFDMRKLRATDVKQNTYVILPKSQGVQYESGLEMRRNKYMSVFRDYVRNNCDEKSRQKSNLSAKENRGIKKLKKRLSEGEIMICLTDKSGRFAVMPMEMYHEAAKVHYEKDKEITFEEAEDIQD